MSSPTQTDYSHYRPSHSPPFPFPPLSHPIPQPPIPPACPIPPHFPNLTTPYNPPAISPAGLVNTGLYFWRIGDNST